jgi:capsular exopolysaccharide synthesis family protein
VRFLLVARNDEPEHDAAEHHGLSRSRVVMVSSASMSEGKTATAANLAVAAARVGLRTVLIDADLRRPAVAKRFGLGRTTGLSDALLNGEPPESHAVDVGVDDLLVLPAGTIPPNPAELLASPAMRALQQSLLRKYDLVVIDTPAVLAVPDALEIGPYVDLAIMVGRVGQTSRRRLGAAIERLRPGRHRRVRDGAQQHRPVRRRLLLRLLLPGGRGRPDRPQGPGRGQAVRREAHALVAPGQPVGTSRWSAPVAFPGQPVGEATRHDSNRDPRADIRSRWGLGPERGSRGTDRAGSAVRLTAASISDAGAQNAAAEALTAADEAAVRADDPVAADEPRATPQPAPRPVMPRPTLAPPGPAPATRLQPPDVSATVPRGRPRQRTPVAAMTPLRRRGRSQA